MRNNSVPPDIQALFGDPPLLSTEDPNVYRHMRDRFAESVAPRNIIEWLWVKGHNGDPGNERADALANRGMAQVRAGSSATPGTPTPRTPRTAAEV